MDKGRVWSTEESETYLFGAGQEWDLICRKGWAPDRR